MAEIILIERQFTIHHKAIDELAMAKAVSQLGDLRLRIFAR